jgi:hypothetical protein
LNDYEFFFDSLRTHICMIEFFLTALAHIYA